MNHYFEQSDSLPIVKATNFETISQEFVLFDSGMLWVRSLDIHTNEPKEEDNTNSKRLSLHLSRYLAIVPPSITSVFGLT